jgi:DNA-binding XRE family transcriptional regulator
MLEMVAIGPVSPEQPSGRDTTCSGTLCPGSREAANLRPPMGEELRRAREAARLTQERLAFRSGLSRPYISQLERGLDSPMLRAHFRVCDALGGPRVGVRRPRRGGPGG